MSGSTPWCSMPKNAARPPEARLHLVDDEERAAAVENLLDGLEVARGRIDDPSVPLDRLGDQGRGLSRRGRLDDRSPYGTCSPFQTAGSAPSGMTRSRSRSPCG